ncbi:MAG TPA: PKD domain-containing protein [Candidatus Thermoplasmatota archaeon]|nr:PKD domain-containing protein [Candidatus Thermoplasmatota archaeon]
MPTHAFRVAALALLFVLLSPVVAAAAQVEILRVDHPDLVLADRKFPLVAEVLNLGEETIRVALYAALYGGPGGPCGGEGSERFRGFIHTRVGLLTLAPGAYGTLAPAGDEPWWMSIPVASTRAREERVEVCVFAADHEATAGRPIQWLDHASVEMRLRAANDPPTVRIEKAEPVEGSPARFRFVAAAQDPDGDAVKVEWDFGRYDATGRARGKGFEAFHTFYPAGRYVVTANASDGFDVASATVAIEAGEDVARPGATDDAPPRPPSLVPVPAAALAVVAVAVASRLARRR